MMQSVETSLTPGGSGGKSERTESGRTEIQDGRMLQRAIRQGWISADRFPTRMSPDEIEQAAGGRDRCNLVEKAAITAGKLMDSADQRSQGIGAKLAVQMEVVNQRDEHHAEGDRHFHNVNIQSALTVEQRRALAIAELNRILDERSRN